MHILLAMAYLSSVPIAAAAAVVLLAIYKRAVRRAMRESVTAATQAPSPSQPPPRSGHRAALSRLDLDSSTASDLSRSGGPLYRLAGHRLMVTALVYVLGGTAFIAIEIAAQWIAFEGRGGLRLGSLFWNFAWPFPLTIGLIAATTRLQRLALLATYLGLAAALLALDCYLDPSLDLGGEAMVWAVEGLVGMTVFLFLHRRIRAVGPMILAIVFMTLLGALSGFSLLVQLVKYTSYRQGTAGYSLLTLMFAHFSDAELAVLLHLVGGVPFFVVGWLLMKWIGRLYRRKLLSTQSVVLDSIWLSLACVGVSILSDSGAWVVAPLAAFAAYWLVVQACFRMISRRHPRAGPAPGLLVLRVFALKGRSEQLFDALSKRWLQVGPIALIAGPDLVKRIVQPHEFLEFLGGRLSRRFVHDEGDLEQRLNDLDTAADPDGRYRVNEFFCNAATWQMAMRRLAERSDAILMDLRNFSPGNRGSLYELQALIELGMMERALILVDRTTDIPFLESTLQRLWSELGQAPSIQDATPPRLRLVHVRDDLGEELRALTRILFGLHASLVSPESGSIQTSACAAVERLREIDLTRPARPFRFIKWANYVLVIFSMSQLIAFVMMFVTAQAITAGPGDLFILIAIAIYAYAFHVGWTNIGALNAVLRPQTLIALVMLTAYSLLAGAILMFGFLGAPIAEDAASMEKVGAVAAHAFAIVGALLGIAAVYRARLVRVKGLDLRLSQILRRLEDYARARPAPKAAPPRNRALGLLYLALGLIWLGAMQLIPAEIYFENRGLGQASALGYFLLIYARSHFQPKVEALFAADARMPIVFLRSFADDEKIGYQSADSALIDFSLESSLAGHFSRLGPFVAVGAPEDKLPHLGAARAALSDDQWQGTVLGWMDRAQIIVLMAGITHWVNWELQTIVARGHAGKLILVFPQSRIFLPWRRRRNLEMRVAAVRGAFAGSPWEPALASLSTPAQRLRCLAFEPTGHVVAITSRVRSRASYHLAALLAHYLILQWPGPSGA